MSLRLKFGILLGLLGLAVLLALGASWWTIATLNSNVREPLRSMAGVLQALGECKAAIEQERQSLRQSPSLPPPLGAPGFKAWAETIEPRGEILSPFTPAAVAEFNAHTAAALSALRTIEAEDWKIRSGTTSLGNLNARVRETQRLGQRLFTVWPPTPPLRRMDAEQYQGAWHEALGSLDSLHNLIERIEDRVVAETQSALAHDNHLSGLLLGVLGWSMAIVVLSVVQGHILFRRWVVRQVQTIRTATAKLAEGDFAYRIPIAEHDQHSNDELLQLGAEVNHMAGMVKAMQDERVEQERLAALAEMIRRLAHNLRNPLAGIRGLAELTRAELPALGPQANDIKENQDRIITSVDRFEKWLNELLSATKPLSVNPEPTAVAPWLKGLVDAHRPSAQTRGVELVLDTAAAPLEATFDARHLEYALSAILSNALEATSSPQARGESPSGGRVLVAVLNGQQYGQSGQTWTINITDQGHGVPPDLRESIFRPYFTTKRDGNGIGLAIALQVVKAHGGQIRIESPIVSYPNGSTASQSGSPDAKGTRFTISLPVHGPVLANDSDMLVARNGRSGALGGQDPRH